MIVHLLSGHNKEIVIAEDEKVSVVKKRIQQLIGRPNDNISLVYNGIILDDNNTLSEYDITNNSVITAVNPPISTHLSVKEQEKQVEEYLISLCTRLKPVPSTNNEPIKVSDDESTKIFSEFLSKTNFARSMEITEIFKKILSINELGEKLNRNNIFSSILGGASICRDILLSHPLITKLIVLNPGFQEILDDDNNIIEFVNTIKDASSNEAKLSIMQRIEQKMGKPLVLAPEHIAFANDLKDKIENAKHTPVKHKKITISERQLNVLCNIARKRPAVIVAFLKKTPLYRHLIHKNPELIKRILTSERLQLLFSPQSLSTIFEINDIIGGSE